MKIHLSTTHSVERSLGEVTQRSCATLGRGVNVVVSSVRQDLLWHRRGNDTSTSRSRDEPHVDRTALGVYFAWHGMWVSKLGTPVASSDRDDGKLGQDDSGSNSIGDFFGALDAEANMSLVITNHNGGLESEIEENRF